jgi:P2 family phage contractile tail tube protein
MPDVAVNRVTNASVVIDGVQFVGRAEEVDFPKPKSKFADHKGLGMAFTIRAWAGVEAFEMRIKWAGIYDEIEILTNSPFNAHYFQVRSSVDVWTSVGRVAQLPVVCLASGVFKDAGTFAFKLHDNVDYTSLIEVYHSELYIDGIQTELCDAFSNMWLVNGIDQLTTFRANLGA